MQHCPKDRVVDLLHHATLEELLVSRAIGKGKHSDIWNIGAVQRDFQLARIRADAPRTDQGVECVDIGDTRLIANETRLSANSGCFMSTQSLRNNGSELAAIKTQIPSRAG